MMKWTVKLEGGPRRVNHAAVLLGDGNIYSFGGYCSNENPSANDPIDIHALNPDSFRWRRVVAANEPLRHDVKRNRGAEVEEEEEREEHEGEEDEDEEMDDEEDGPSAFNLVGNVVVLRADSDDEADDEEMDEEHEEEEDKMEEGNSREVPYQRYGHTVVEYGGKAYLWGGRNDENGASSALHCYDPVTRCWSAVPIGSGTPPPARDGHSALIHDGKMYIFGGFEEEIQRFSQETFIFDFATSTWSEMMTRGERPKWRDFHTAVVLEHTMYVYGGRCDQMGQYHSMKDEYDKELWALDLNSGAWRKVEVHGQRPTGRRSHSAWTYGGCMYIFGGYYGNKNAHFDTMYKFDPEKSEWSKVAAEGARPCERRRQCTVVANDKVYLFGGTMPLPSTSVPQRSQNATLGLCDLADLYVLDYSPSLFSLAALSVLDQMRRSGFTPAQLHMLPYDVRNDLLNMTRPNPVMDLRTRKRPMG